MKTLWFKRSLLLPLIFILFILLALFLALHLVKQRQELRKKAQEEPSFTGKGQVIARTIDNYLFGGYTGPLTPSPPHADGNPKKAVVVEWSDKNYKFVFWHEASYVPFWEFSDGTGLSYQFFEGAHGSGELFNQYGRKERNSHVEIVEGGPNRVKITWEYYDVNKDTGERVGRGVETYTFHPNGLVLKEMRFYPIKADSFEPMEMFILNPKGTYWWNHIPKVGDEYRTYTLLDAYSSKSRRGYASPNPDDINNAKNIRTEGVSRGTIESLDGVIARVHLNDLDSFTIYGKATGLANDEIMEVGEWGYTHFVHWPIGWLNSEWKEATREEVKTYPTHTSIIGVNHQGNGPYKWLIGVSDRSNKDLQQLAQEWLANPDKIPDWEETGKASLNFKVKFQGINQQRPDKTVRVILKQGTQEKYQFDSISVSSNQNGIYSGTVTNIDPGAYDIYLKGWVHLQKKFSGIILVAGENNQDFSGSQLLAGDSTKDNRVNAQDIVILVQDYRPNTPLESLADFNLDGVVNAQDVRFLVENYRQEGE